MIDRKNCFNNKDLRARIVLLHAKNNKMIKAFVNSYPFGEIFGRLGLVLKKILRVYC